VAQRPLSRRGFRIVGAVSSVATGGR
jgi:hypothetical protein